MERVRVGLEWFLNPSHLPWLVGHELGLFLAEGLDVELVEPDAVHDALGAIERGEFDLAISEPLNVVQAVSVGRPVMGFARFLHTNGGVMYLESSGITRPRDMAGRRVQYPGAPDPGGPAIVATMIEQDGGDSKALVTINCELPHADALIEGRADVATLVFYNFEVVEARARGHAAQFFSLRDWGVPDFCQLALVTTRGMLRRRENVYRRLVYALRRGIDQVRQRPELARDIWCDRTGASPDEPLGAAIFAATLPCFTYDLGLTDEFLVTLSAWMHRRGLIDREVAAAQCWTNRLAY